jgi:hypothetical protein
MISILEVKNSVYFNAVESDSIGKNQNSLTVIGINSFVKRFSCICMYWVTMQMYLLLEIVVKKFERCHSKFSFDSGYLIISKSRRRSSEDGTTVVLLDKRGENSIRKKIEKLIIPNVSQI